MRKIEKIDDILESITEIVFPFVVIFGIYVVLNGHLSPGGGFSGGAILSAGLILYDVVFNQDNAPILPMKTYGIITSSALLVYGTLKGYSFTMGAAHKPTGIPLGIPGNILSSGLILPLNICVGVVVGTTMYALYRLFLKGEL